MRKHAVVYGFGAAGLGLTGLIVGDFALQWQPVPQDVAGRVILAYASALALIVAAISVLTWRFPMGGTCALTALYGIWATLHVPRVIAAPLGILPWLGFAEIVALGCGGLMLALTLAGPGRLAAKCATQLAFGGCALVWGLSHFGYPDATASMIPKWIPARLFWAYATGVGHFAAGVALIAGASVAFATPIGFGMRTSSALLTRLAASMLAAMLASFTLLVHVTGVLGDPGSRREWTMLFVAASLAGAAWIVSAALARIHTETVQRRAPAIPASGAATREGLRVDSAS